MANILDMPDTTSYYSKSDNEGNKLMAVLSYIGILVLVPILAAKDSPFAKYHAAQGLNLLIVDVAWCIVSGIVSLIFGLTGVTFLSVLWTIVTWLVGIALFLMMVIGIINAAQGRAKELPLIGGFRILR